jgi:hypothetical protein
MLYFQDVGVFLGRQPGGSGSSIQTLKVMGSKNDIFSHVSVNQNVSLVHSRPVTPDIWSMHNILVLTGRILLLSTQRKAHHMQVAMACPKSFLGSG